MGEVSESILRLEKHIVLTFQAYYTHSESIMNESTEPHSDPDSKTESVSEQKNDSLRMMTKGWLSSNQDSVILFITAVTATLLSSIYYIIAMLELGMPGFTLDDSWIHLQFARTIYEGTPWEYSPGYPSTGSTSPLWSLLLSVLFIFSSDTITLVWGVFLISMVFFIACSYLVGHLVRNYTESVSWGTVAIIGFVIIPRNTWLMLSGMETPLFLFILLLSIWFLDKTDLKYDLLLGVIAGLAYLSRPEGIIVAILLIPTRFVLLGYQKGVSYRRIQALFLSAVIAFLIVIPWILHCMSVTGYPLPDTFYAKVHAPTEFEKSAWDTWWQFFIREMPFLTIGMAAGAYLILRKKPYPWILAVALTILYRLSTPYASLINNARYLVPIFDLFFITAIVFSAWLIRHAFTMILKLKEATETRFLAVTVVTLLLVVPVIPYYMEQANYFSKSVRTINDMHVNIGNWIADNTPEDAVFATHDAGAIRFISGRRMIDIAGLVSPDIIHGNMTPPETLRYLHEQGCNYFVFFDELFQYWRIYLPWSAVEQLYTVHIPPEIYASAGRDTMSVWQILWEYTSY